MNAAAFLKQSAARLNATASLASLPVGAATIYYSIATITLPPGATVPLLVLAVGLIVVLSAYTAFRYARQLKTVRAISRGKAPASEANLRQVAAEVYGVPDLVFRMNAVTWLGAVVVLLVGLKLWVPALDQKTMVRMAIAAAAFFPVGGLLSYLLSAREGRKVIAALPSLGLPPEQLRDAIARSPVRVRTRLMVFSAILVLVPSAVIAHLSVAVLERGMERVQAETDPAEQARLADEAVAIAIRAIAILGSAVVAFALVAAWAGASAIAEPLRALARDARRLQQGDLSRTTVIAAEDELWDVSAAFTAVQAQLLHGISQLQRAGLQMSSTAEQLSAMAGRHVGGATEQAGALQQTSATTEELARVSEQIAGSGRGVEQRAAETVAAARAGQAQTSQFDSAMRALQTHHQKISGAVTELERRVILIRGLVTFIGSVADRADLLALNADLESTKVGDAGRGFSLVASEMRRLGEEVGRSTQQILNLIEEVREATSQALRATETGGRTTLRGMELAKRVSEGLGRIVALAEDTARAAAQISAATEHQRSASTQLAASMTEVLEVTRENERGSGGLRASTTDLATLAHELKEVVQGFKLPS